MERKNVIISGGGIAGLTAAIHLSRLGQNVTLIEKHRFPRHKVCGEYISNEVLAYLKWLGADPDPLHPTAISRTQISTVDGKIVDAVLPLGGFGVSRYTFDHFLCERAMANGCTIVFDSVTAIEFSAEQFTVALASGSSLSASVVLGAFGKRSHLDVQMNRRFITKKAPWLAVKAHYQGEFPSNLVALHNFRGGYCGVSKVEDDKINICYLASYESFKQYRNIADYERQVVGENPHLERIFSRSTMLFDKPLTISQISFEHKRPVEQHILMIGDAAGLINPLCGNGMAMAIHSSKIASELTHRFLSGYLSRTELEQHYAQQWELNFNRRIKAGRILADVLQRQVISKFMVSGLTAFPSLLPAIIRQTHGDKISVNP